MYALVKIQGKQYRAEEGVSVQVDRIDVDEGQLVEFDSVLLVKDDENVRVGTPFVAGVTVTARVESHGRGQKIVIFKHKKRKNYRRKMGFRDHHSVIRFEGIVESN